MVVLKYTYAWDETKTSLVHINDAQKGRVYYCLNPDCDERLSVREGEDRRKHYYHIKNGDKCSYDNYLHTLAEKRIVEWFNSGDKIDLKLKAKTICSNYDECIWRSGNINDNNNCFKFESRSFVLNKLYNKIEREKKQNGFIWDLLLTNTNLVDRPPIAIEIFVTHQCEIAKTKTGIRIIEINLQSEAHLDDIISSNTLIEDKDFVSYNFEVKPHRHDNFKIRLNKVFINDKMESIWKLMDCKSYTKRLPNSILEFTFDYYLLAENTSYFNSYYWGCAILYRKFPTFKHCSLCKYYKYNTYYNEHICMLYKTLNLQDKHRATNAINCPKIQIDEQRIKEAIEKMKYLSFNVWEKKDNIEGRNFKRKFEILQ
ncbi:MAG: hypothetical protein IJ413_00340 [Bacteroides sp.]|nr:hypothetical protein [Bacteroides sp.]